MQPCVRLGLPEHAIDAAMKARLVIKGPFAKKLSSDLASTPAPLSRPILIAARHVGGRRWGCAPSLICLPTVPQILALVLAVAFVSQRSDSPPNSGYATLSGGDAWPIPQTCCGQGFRPLPCDPALTLQDFNELCACTLRWLRSLPINLGLPCSNCFCFATSSKRQGHKRVSWEACESLCRLRRGMLPQLPAQRAHWLPLNRRRRCQPSDCESTPP